MNIYACEGGSGWHARNAARRRSLASAVACASSCSLLLSRGRCRVLTFVARFPAVGAKNTITKRYPRNNTWKRNDYTVLCLDADGGTPHAVPHFAYRTLLPTEGLRKKRHRRATRNEPPMTCTLSLSNVPRVVPHFVDGSAHGGPTEGKTSADNAETKLRPETGHLARVMSPVFPAYPRPVPHFVNCAELPTSLNQPPWVKKEATVFTS